MITRSKAKHVLTQPNVQLQTNPTGLQRSGTVVKIEPSATGEGTHKRWIYAQDAAEEEQAGIDIGKGGSSTAPHETCAEEAASMGGRFTTPAPTLTEVRHGAPRKSTAGRRNRATTPMSPLGKVEEGATQGLHAGESQRQGHGSQFRNPFVLVPLALSPIHPARQFQPTPPCDPGSSGTTVGRRQALGPTGTLLFDEECNPIYMR